MDNALPFLSQRQQQRTCIPTRIRQELEWQLSVSMTGEIYESGADASKVASMNTTAEIFPYWLLMNGGLDSNIVQPTPHPVSDTTLECRFEPSGNKGYLPVNGQSLMVVACWRNS